MKALVAVACSGFMLLAQTGARYSAPAGDRPAVRHLNSPGILPGGRILAPLGEQLITGPGPFGIAISPSGRTVVTSNIGMERFSLTIMEKTKGVWSVRNFAAPREKQTEEEKFEQIDVADPEWRSVFMGLAFAGEKSIWASEGNSGRVRLVDVADGRRKRTVDLNGDGYADSFTGDLVLDPKRELLYVVDQANFRLVVVDARKGQVLSSVAVGRLPFAIALSPDGRRVYVTNVGMFQYQALPKASKRDARATGLPFPAFGFPSPEALHGAKRLTEAGEIDVPGLGDPNVDASNSLCVVNVSDPAAPKVEKFIRTGLPFGGGVSGGSSPSGVLATGGRVFVSNAHNDSITAIDAATLNITGEIRIAIPGLGDLRGVLPMGMAFDSRTDSLLVAEAGMNAIGIVEMKANRISHVPTGWFPTRIAIHEGAVFVANARGQGTGPNVHGLPSGYDDPGGFINVLRRGSVSAFPFPDNSELPKLTGKVFALNGLAPGEKPAPLALPPVKHVVLIVKENRTFDEVFGDLTAASNGKVAGAPALARFGASGFAVGGKDRLSLQRIDVTPNHHDMAARWSFSDNFYADSDVSVDGHHWLVGAPPDAWTESSLLAGYGGQKKFLFPTSAPGRLLFAESDSSVHPEEQGEGGTLWHHLERFSVPFRNFGEGFELAGVDEGPALEPTGARFLTNVPMPDPLYRHTSREYPGFNMNIPDQYRADRFIQEIEAKYAKSGENLPQFIYIHLPNDHIAPIRPEDGYPYPASYVADNDYALGRIVEYLSHSRWWRDMAIFVTEDDAQGGRDHIDAHRTVLLGIGPYCRKNYVSHRNSSFPGLLKTIFELLAMPPLNLFDATASDLSDMFAKEPDFAVYSVLPEDARLFDPKKARGPLVARPSIRMDRP